MQAVPNFKRSSSPPPPPPFQKRQKPAKVLVNKGRNNVVVLSHRQLHFLSFWLFGPALILVNDQMTK